jgi:hypothetical protein
VDTTHYTIDDTVNRIKKEILKKEAYYGRWNEKINGQRECC